MSSFFFTEDPVLLAASMISPATVSYTHLDVYKRQVVGCSPKAEDIVVNVCKKKHITNTRASGSDDALRLSPPRVMSLEETLEFIRDDELVEVTPESIRVRKRILDHQQRLRANNKK